MKVVPMRHSSRRYHIKFVKTGIAMPDKQIEYLQPPSYSPATCPNKAGKRVRNNN